MHSQKDLTSSGVEQEISRRRKKKAVMRKSRKEEMTHGWISRATCRLEMEGIMGSERVLFHSTLAELIYNFSHFSLGFS